MRKKFNGLGSGEADRLFTWLRRSYSTDSGSGAQIPTWTANGTLWGSLDESSGSYVDSFGTTRNRTNVAIVLRQFPQIAAGDRLQDVQFGHTYICDFLSLDWRENTTTFTGYRLEGDTV